MSAVIGAAYDLLLCAGLLWVALQAMRIREAFGAVVVFMVFGLLMAVVWARLGSPDLALAEAIIGAGVTGALLLNACQAVQTDPGARRASARVEPSPGLPHGLIVAVCIAAGASLAALMALALEVPGPTADAARAGAAAHPLGNPVTVVLLDFRAYDTLMEMVVLLAAFLGARVLIDQSELAPLHPPVPADPPMVAPLLAMATPVLVLTSLYLFWAGSHAPGGAFQAGALLGGLGVLYRLTGRLEPYDHTPIWLRTVLVVGLIVFSGVVLAAALWSPWPMRYPETGLYPLVLAIEFALLLSIAATLTALFSGTAGFRPHTGARS